MLYFENCFMVEQVKKLYRELALKLHPDKGGNDVDFRVLNEQYLRKLASFDGQKSYDAETKKAYTYRYNKEVEEEILMKVSQLMKFNGVDVMLIGSWLWIEGETKPCKDELKKLGCLWHSKRFMWYWRQSDQKHYGKHSVCGLEHLAEKYGYKQFSRTGVSIREEA